MNQASNRIMPHKPLERDAKQVTSITSPRVAMARAICESCGDKPDHKGDAQGREFRWQDYLSAADAALAAIAPFMTMASEPAAFVNGDELDNMLDDRTATIETNRSGWRKTPLYSSAALALAGGKALEWRSIKTAPKDGTEVLLYLGAPWSRVAKARWFAPWATWIEGEFPEKDDERCGIGSGLPTHWMPVPLEPIVDELRSAVRGLVHDGWLPIAAAPKDGTEVLLYLGRPYHRVSMAKWFSTWNNWIEGDLPDVKHDEYGGIGCNVPTHYMPLPAPPVTTKEG